MPHFSFDRLMPDGRTVHLWKPRPTFLKVNITYLCDRGCPRCNRATKVAPSCHAEDLSPEKFSAMIEECISEKKLWYMMCIEGGEPVLHPRFDEFVDIAMGYKHKFHPLCNVAVATYHHPNLHWKIEKVAAKYPDLTVMDSMKAEPLAHRFNPYGDPSHLLSAQGHVWRGCHGNGTLCGLCYDYRGFYTCVVAATIGRVFGLDGVAIQRVTDLTLDKLTDQYEPACSRCGYSIGATAKGPDENVSPMWQDAISKYLRGRRKG